MALFSCVAVGFIANDECCYIYELTEQHTVTFTHIHTQKLPKKDANNKKKKKNTCTMLKEAKNM